MAPMELCNIDLKTHSQELLESDTNGWLSACSASSQPSMITFFDGSRVNPIKEASLFLDQIRYLDDDGAILEENVKEDQEVVSWLVPSIKNEPRGNHSRKFSLFDSDLGSPLKWHKDYKWVLDKMFDLASSVSSVTNSSDWNSSSFSSLSSFSSFSSDNPSEIMDLEECSFDKPLFWPSDMTPEWGLNTEWDLFIMSPRKHVCIASNSVPSTPPDTPRLQLWNAKMDSEKGSKRRLVFHSRSNSSTSLDLKTTNGTRSVRRMKSMPASRFKKGTKTNDDGCTKESSEDKELVKKATIKPKVLLEDLILTEKLNAEPNIESILGLEEFDGHEGIEFEFNKDDFFLNVII
ncbi:hypothetical protein Tco_1500759 [Tanacetum coccineum]